LTTLGLIIGVVCVSLPARGADIGTAFTYQGSLEKPAGTPVGSPTPVTCDFRFDLWDAAMFGNQIGNSPLWMDDVSVSDGLFTVLLDFGANAFNGTARWLSIEVKCLDETNHVLLTPRVQVTPAPLALALPGLRTEQTAATPNVVGGFPWNYIPQGVVGATIAGGGTAFESTDGRCLFSPQILCASDTDCPITDPKPFCLPELSVGRCDNDNALCDGSQECATGVCILPPQPHQALANYVSIGGGSGNVAGGGLSLGGVATGAKGFYSVVGGGLSNTASAPYSTVDGGRANLASGDHSTVGGGYTNAASGYFSTVGGGHSNTASNFNSTVGGGDTNAASGLYSTVGGGVSNNASNDYATVSGGVANRATHYNAAVGGGFGNQAVGNTSTVCGGFENVASKDTASIGGGYQNVASGNYSTVPGGRENLAGGAYSFAAGARGKIRDAVATGEDPFLCPAMGTCGDEGTFVWADIGTFADFISTGPNQFLIRASGGMRLATGNGTTPQFQAILPSTNTSTNLALQPLGGNVGIGTSTPGFPLTFPNTLGDKISLWGQSGDHYGFGVQSNLLQIHTASPSSDVAFGYGQSSGFIERMRIKGTGNVGIGTNVPQNQLHVANTPGGGAVGLGNGIHIGGDAGGNPHIEMVGNGWSPYIDLSNDNAADFDARIILSGNDALSIEGANVGVGRTPAANRLEVDGDASKTTAGDWLANSDRRIKTDIGEIENALDTLDRVRPVKFKYSEAYRCQHPSIKDTPYYNYVAQEFAEVFPDFVQDSGEDGILQLDAYPVSVVAVAAIQELHQIVQEKDCEIEALRERDRSKDHRVGDLEERNAKLDARLARLEALLSTISTKGEKP